MADYKDKCGTCRHIRLSHAKKTGTCALPDKRWIGAIGISRLKCSKYQYCANSEYYCKCGEFKYAKWNYCPNCGERWTAANI